MVSTDRPCSAEEILKSLHCETDTADDEDDSYLLREEVGLESKVAQWYEPRPPSDDICEDGTFFMHIEMR